ncbi:glycosyltransferase family 4 protein [Halococcus qingdaonensis]|uniref:glycosyltransferase family 4 protein n=1 Tax=Halococcus qingdaonensis TaxID=224402 RepID=UPI0021163003|nr:glycosyltransferase family 4 protein [Halococcus qingdaonensis]
MSDSHSSSLADANILQVITRSDWGGAPLVVKLLATRTEANTAVACGTGGRLIDELQQENVPVFEQPSLQSPPDPVADTRAFADLYRLFRRESFDLVHCHSTKAGLLGRLAARLTGTPTIFTVHGWGFYNTGYDRAAPVIAYGERALARITDAVVCVAENDLVEGRSRGIVEHTETTVIHNGIPSLSSPQNRLTLSEEADIEPDSLVIGAIARLDPAKNPIEILRIGSELQQRGHEIELVMIGDGPLAEKCERYADEHNIDVHFLGFYMRARELLEDFDVFLMPSRFEGFPITVLECLHAGVPVVAYDVGGIAEAVTDGETGFVIPSGNQEAFVDRVEKLVADPKRRKAMSAHAETVAQSHYTAKRMVADYERVYNSVIGTT